jgi:uncharacterized protein
MKIDILSIFFSFSLFSILGWMLEVTYRSPRDRRFVNPGLLKGPYLPLYGTGALLLMVAGSLLSGSNVVTKIFVYFFLTTGLELVSGFIAHHFFAASLWDYSDQRFNFRGHVCLKFSIYWILLAFTFEGLILPPFQALLIFLPVVVKVLFVIVVLVTMFSDFLAVSMRHLLRMTAAEKTLLETQFIATARPLLDLPEVASLAQYEHHRGKSRLDHVTEVARLSFHWSQRFDLDSKATIRGALLHDLFYYDWLREGPRLHGFRHHNIALENARKITSLSKKEEDIIKRHMWPLTVVPPRYTESLIVSLVDTFCSTRDYLSIRKHGDSAVAAVAPMGLKTKNNKE